MNGRMTGILAKEIMGRPDAHVASFEWLDEERDGIDGTRVVLLDAPLVTKGKNAGRPNWRKATNRQVRILPHALLESAAEEWSQRTGLCTSCVGDGRSLHRWHHTEGTFWTPCRKCNGTGSRDGETIAETRRTEMWEANS